MIFPVNVNLDVAPLPIEFKAPDSQEVCIVEVFHCDGLLLCNTYKDDKYKLMVWNPCLGETRWIQNRTSFSRCSFALGYQNNKSFRSYKILNCWSTHYTLDNGDAGFEIYELSSDSWRVLDCFALNCSLLPIHGVSLKGNAYWLALESTGYFVLSFDFTSDSFKRLCLPPVQNPWNVVLSVVREEKLSLLTWPLPTPYMEVWVTDEIDTQAALWSKSFRVEFNNPYFFSIRFACFLIDEEKKVILCCNSDFEHIKKLYIFGEGNEYYKEIPSVESAYRTLHPFISSYVPSLVQIQQGGNK